MVYFPEKIILKKEEFRLLRDLVHENYGIFFDDDAAYIFERRLNSRIHTLGLSSFIEYYRYLCYSPQCLLEQEQVVEMLTTNETYFFREEYQLKAFSEEILPELIQQRKNNNKRLRIWSAGCSSGEEAYTIGILIRENSAFADWNVEIFGNDISRRMLKNARQGNYSKSSFRTMNAYYLNKYFRREGERYQIIDDKLRSIVNFGQLNLVDEEMLKLVGNVDIVFCRNVLIYFDMAVRLRVLKTFYDKLYDKGYLLLGHSESLFNISTDFEAVNLKNDMVYRKPSIGLGVKDSK